MDTKKNEIMGILKLSPFLVGVETVSHYYDHCQPVGVQ